MVEALGAAHDGCPPDCTEAHAYFYVRVKASSSTAPPGRRERRRLDLAVDLQPALRCTRLEDLLAMTDVELQDAWVLLEPRPAADGSGGAGDAGGASSSMHPKVPAAAGAAGPWHTKRAEKHTDGQLAAKRRRAAVMAPAAAATAASACAVPKPAATAESLVWALFAGTWWPGMLLAGELAQGGQAQVEVFVAAGMRLALPAASVSQFNVDRQARTAALMQSDLGRRAVERSNQLLGERDGA